MNELIDRSVGFLLGRAYHRFRTRLERGLAERGLAERVTPGMGGILFHLHAVGECPIHEVVQAVGIGKAGVTNLLRSMQGKDLIARRNDPDDRRVVHVRLTARAKRLMPRLQTLHDELEAELATILGSDHRSVAKGLAAILSHDWDETAPSGPTTG